MPASENDSQIATSSIGGLNGQILDEVSAGLALRISSSL
jgi:hypothetical protein